MNGPDQTGGPNNRFPPIGASAIWDQHFGFSRPQRDARIDGKSETRILRISLHRLLMFFFIGERKITWKFVFFHNKSGRQEDNQASIFDCHHSFFGSRKHKDTWILLPWWWYRPKCKDKQGWREQLWWAEEQLSMMIGTAATYRFPNILTHDIFPLLNRKTWSVIDDWEYKFWKCSHSRPNKTKSILYFSSSSERLQGLAWLFPFSVTHSHSHNHCPPSPVSPFGQNEWPVLQS